MLLDFCDLSPEPFAQTTPQPCLFVVVFKVIGLWEFFGRKNSSSCILVSLINIKLQKQSNWYVQVSEQVQQTLTEQTVQPLGVTVLEHASTWSLVISVQQLRTASEYCTGGNKEHH